MTQSQRCSLMKLPQQPSPPPLPAFPRVMEAWSEKASKPCIHAVTMLFIHKLLHTVNVTVTLYINVYM